MWSDFKNVEWIHSLAAGVNGLTSIPEVLNSEVTVTNCKGNEV